MHNLIRTTTDIEEGLKRTQKGLHDEKREFLRTHIERLKDAYKDYDNHAANGTLHEIEPLWKDAAEDTQEEKSEKQRNRDLAKGLYGSNRPVINKHWEELKCLNGNSTLMCPICGIHECSEMDHYIPISVMHEYSVHLTNLIPLCHDCNHKKLEKWLNEPNHERIIFNAYFDREIPQPVIHCIISLSETDNLPEIDVEQNPELKEDNPLHRVILSTIETLGLMECFRSTMRIVFKEELIRLESIFRNRLSNMRAKERWDEVKRCYQANIEHHGNRFFLNECMYSAIIHSRIMEQWFIGIE